MDSGSQDRNLPASQRKLQKAKDDGQVSRSQDLTHLAALGAGAVALMMLAPLLFDHLHRSMVQQMTFDTATVMQTSTMFQRLSGATAIGLAACAAFAAIVNGASICAALASGGWVLSLKPMMPDFSRVSPLKGLGNLFSKKKLLSTLKILILTIVLFAIAGRFLQSGLQTIAPLLLQPSKLAIAQLTQWMLGGLGLMLLVLVLAAMIDVPLQAFLHGEEMKMSHQEAKQEGKESDGNPEVKGRMRQKQRELAQKSSVGKVPTADFVVMNPTHFAVAIRYDEKTMHAPQVISKGADLLALRIRDLAKSHAIPVLESPMLARALYANAELNQDIPSNLYTAVAQVLAYIYRLRAAMRGDGPMPTEVPQPFVPPELDPQSKHREAVLT